MNLKVIFDVELFWCVIAVLFAFIFNLVCFMRMRFYRCSSLVSHIFRMFMAFLNDSLKKAWFCFLLHHMIFYFTVHMSSYFSWRFQCSVFEFVQPSNDNVVFFFSPVKEKAVLRSNRRTVKKWVRIRARVKMGSYIHQ